KVSGQPGLARRLILNSQSRIASRDLGHDIAKADQVINRALEHHSILCGIEADQAVIRQVQGGIVFPTHSKVQREALVHLEIVLEIQDLFVDLVTVSLPIGPSLIPRSSQK